MPHFFYIQSSIIVIYGLFRQKKVRRQNKVRIPRNYRCDLLDPTNRWCRHYQRPGAWPLAGGGGVHGADASVVCLAAVGLGLLFRGLGAEWSCMAATQVKLLKLRSSAVFVNKTCGKTAGSAFRSIRSITVQAAIGRVTGVHQSHFTEVLPHCNWTKKNIQTASLETPQRWWRVYTVWDPPWLYCGAWWGLGVGFVVAAGKLVWCI